MRVLAVDIGGTNMRFLASGQKTPASPLTAATIFFGVTGGFRMWEDTGGRPSARARSRREA